MKLGIAVKLELVKVVLAEGAPAGSRPAASEGEAVSQGEAIVLRNERSGAAIECACALSERQTAVLLAGGLLNYITSA